VVGRGRGKEGEGDDKGYDENQKFDEFEGNKIKIINFDLPKSLPKSKTSSSSSSSRQIENFGFGQIWKKNSDSTFTISFLADPFDFGSILADPF